MSTVLILGVLTISVYSIALYSYVATRYLAAYVILYLSFYVFDFDFFCITSLTYLSIYYSCMVQTVCVRATSVDLPCIPCIPCIP